MLSYAFRILKQSNYDQVASENFENAQDLFAAILSKGIAQQLKQGLYREYITKKETLSVMRGKLDMPNTIRSRIRRKQKLACEFDELSENNLFNQILKTAIHYLLIDEGVDAERKSALKKILVFFDGIELLEPSGISWSRLHYQRNNKNYELLINICYFVLDGMLQTTEKGEYKMAAFSDEHMARLYEKFILEYYRQHHTYLSEVKAGQVKWNLAGDNSETMIRFLPVMQTDIMLRLKEQILIIDAKYYGKTLQQQYDKYTLHSNNVYQIFTYVKNQDKDNTGKVAGILLYAKTDEDITPDCMFNMGGNQIGAKTLDLNKEFPLIAAQLDKLAERFFEREDLQVFLETDNLILKKVEFKDWKAMYRNVWSRPEAAKYMAWRVTTDEEDAKARIRKTIKYQESHDAYLVYEKTSGQAIGFAGVEETAPHIYQDTGIALGSEYVGKGYGKQILRLLLEYCRSVGGKEFYYSTRANNEASKALALSCGFTYQYAEKKADLRNGELYELEVYHKEI